MQWPASTTVHSDPDILNLAQQTIADIANAVVDFEPVVLLMADHQIGDARRRLSGAIAIWNIPTEDLWCRDAGPCFLMTRTAVLRLWISCLWAAAFTALPSKCQRFANP
jgi:agmatine deiminase